MYFRNTFLRVNVHHSTTSRMYHRKYMHHSKMVKRIQDVPVLQKSLINKNFENRTLDASTVTDWKCGNCKGKWKESIKKRALYKWCPECEPARGRTAKVTHDSKFVKVLQSKYEEPEIPRLYITDCKANKNKSPQSPKSPKQSTSKQTKHVNEPSFTSFERKAIEFGREVVEYAKPYLSLYQKRVDIRQQIEAIKKLINVSRKSSNLSELNREWKKLVARAKELSEDYEIAVSDGPFEERHFNIRAPAKNPEKMLNKFRDYVKDYYDEDGLDNVIKIFQGILDQTSDEERITTEQMDNEKMMTTALKYINGELTDDEWRKEVINQAKQNADYVAFEIAGDQLTKELTSAISNANKQLASAQNKKAVNVAIRQLNEKVESARLKFNETMRSELFMINPSEYELLSPELVWTKGNLVE